MAAHKRRKRKNSKKKKGDNKWILKILPYFIAILLFLFILYRIIVLISFKVDCSAINRSNLSNETSLVNNLFVFEKEGKIVNMEVLIYSRDQKRVLRVNIPTNIYTTHEGVDSFPISSMESVGEFFEHGSGKEFTVEHISNLLGIKFDNYVWLSNSNQETDDFLSKLSIWSVLFDFKYNRELKANLYSNLPILNLIKEVNSLNQTLANYEYEDMDILDCCVEQFVISGDRNEVRFNSRSFDTEFSKYINKLVSKEVERERVNVEVYNASNVSGLASEYARKIRHTGCRILRFDNSPNLYDESIIYIPESEGYENSLQLVQDVVGEDIKVIYDRPVFITTGDIIVVLGKDLAN